MLAPRLLGGVVRVSSVGARRSAPAAFRAAARTGRSFSSPAAATAAKEPPAAATPAAAGTAAAAAKADIREGASGNMLMLGFAGGVVIAAGNLASVVFDNPPACKLAIQIANKNETLKAAVGSVRPASHALLPSGFCPCSCFSAGAAGRRCSCPADTCRFIPCAAGRADLVGVRLGGPSTREPRRRLHPALARQRRQMRVSPPPHTHPPDNAPTPRRPCF